MKKHLKRIIALVLILSMSMAAMTGCKKEKADNSNAEKKEIVILAAASLTDVTAKLKEAYEKEHKDVTLTFSYGSSGALMTQIQEGAPADVFMSAALKQMNTLNEAGLMDSSSIYNLLENKVVLIAPKNSTLSLTSFNDLSKDSVKMVALGESSSVPVGQYSEEILTSLKILDTVNAKAVYGSDVRAVLSYVESGNADCGVVYETDAITSKDIKIICSAPEGSCQKVIYPVGIVKTSKLSDEAKEFIEYLKSDEAMAVFAEYGFSNAQ